MDPTDRLFPYDITTLATVCRKNGIILSVEQHEKFDRYVTLLTEWNEKVNLVSRKDIGNIWASHILHCLSVLFVLKLEARARVLDLGSGGGLPGIPFAIVNEGWEVDLLDSVGKKMNAVRDIVEKMQLTNVRVTIGRAEEVGKTKPFLHQFDIVFARGVAPLEDLIGWSKQFLRKVSGTNTPQLIAYKGGDLENEITRARIKSGRRDFLVHPLIFDGNLDSGLVEKSVVVIPFHPISVIAHDTKNTL